MSTIELTNVGPIEHLSIPVPEAGGVVVLQGPNGAGKSNALNAVDCAVSGRGKVNVRDGQRSAEVDAFGVKITVGRSARRSGELVVESLDGKLSIAELVDPGLKDQGAADLRRIKALVNLSGVLPSAELFHDLLGGRAEFDAVVSPGAASAADLVLMAEAIKRDIERAARQCELVVENEAGRASAFAEAAKGLDLSIPYDADALQAAMEAAVRQDAALGAKAREHNRARLAADLAKDQAEEAGIRYDGPTIEQAADAEAAAQIDATAAQEAFTAAKDALALAEAAMARARSERDSANSVLAAKIQVRKSAERHAQLLEEHSLAMAATIPPAVPKEDLAASAARVTAAREAVERGALVRKQIADKAMAEVHATEAGKHKTRAHALRQAAAGVDDVLSEVVGRTCKQLRVEAGRIVLDTVRGKTPFCELSEGERWRIALDIGIAALAEKCNGRGVLVIPQTAWEGLDGHNRAAIAEHVAGRGVVVLTAEASDDDEITPAVYQPD